MNDTLPEILLACTWRGTLLIAIALIAGPWVRRLCGPGGAHWLWLAVLPVLLWPMPPQSPFSLGSVWRANAPVMEAEVAPDGVLPTEDVEAGPLMVKVRTMETGAAMLPGPGPAGEWMRAVASTSAAKQGGGWREWSQVMTVIWAVGAVACLGHLGGRWWRTRRWLRDARSITDERAAAVLGRFAKRGRVGISTIWSLRAPALAGIWRPRILIPERWLEELSEAELESVLLHELGHHRRADLVWEWLFAIARCLHWMNPAVWLAERMSRQARELACDAWAMERSRYPEHYGEAVLKALQRMQRGPAVARFGVAAMAAADARQMARRLEWIARGACCPRWRVALGWVPALAALVVVGTDPVSAQTQGSAPPAAFAAAATGQERAESREKAAADAPFPLAKRRVEARTRILRVPESTARKLGWPIAEEGSKGIEKVLPAAEYRGILTKLQATPEVELIPGPHLIARGGNPGVFRAVREFRYGRGYKAAADGMQIPDSTETINLGLSISWWPQIKEGSKVDLQFSAALMRLVGFRDRGGSLTKVLSPPPGMEWARRLVYDEMPVGAAGEPVISEQKADVHLTLDTAQVALIFGFREADKVSAPGSAEGIAMVHYFAVQLEILP